jgi:hypothetical protein
MTLSLETQDLNSMPSPAGFPRQTRQASAPKSTLNRGGFFIAQVARSEFCHSADFGLRTSDF